MTHRLLARLLPALLLAAVALCAHAEKADREKPVNFAGDDVNVNYDARTGTLKGNAIITQGTMTVRADDRGSTYSARLRASAAAA